MVFGAFVGFLEVYPLQHCPTRFCLFDIKLVVADKTEYLTIAINAVIAKHFPGGDFACAFTLISYVLY